MNELGKYDPKRVNKMYEKQRERIAELEIELTALKHDHDRLMDRCTYLTNKLSRIEFRQHLKQCSDEVKTWPKWKRDCL